MRILIAAGEASGDHHGAMMASCLIERRPDLELIGLGGDHMRDAGVELLYPLADLAVVGFVEVIKGFREFKRVYDLTVEYARSHKIDCAVLIDNPGFNLRLAAALKRLGIPVIYYISPQVWAWGRWRLPKMRRLLDHMIVILPFEESFFRINGIEATFVGHPLLDDVGSEKSRATSMVSVGLDPNRPLVGLLPGSRKVEVGYMLETMVDSAGLIRQKHPEAQVVLLRAPTLSEELLAPYVRGRGIPILQGNDYGLRKSLDVAITASGTATLVNAILEVPTIICYRTSAISYQLAKRLAHVDRIGLVNIIANEMICPELIQAEMNPQRIYQETSALLSDPGKKNAMRQKLSQVRHLLGDAGASTRAAEVVLRKMQEIFSKTA